MAQEKTGSSPRRRRVSRSGACSISREGDCEEAKPTRQPLAIQKLSGPGGCFASLAISALVLMERTPASLRIRENIDTLQGRDPASGKVWVPTAPGAGSIGDG